jgi:hypothetical protein
MKISQQIVGVNQRLGNTAVPNMQGTTRIIYDTRAATGANQTLTYFTGVSSRLYPLANINQNKFEVGESLAIQGFSIFAYTTADPTLATNLAPFLGLALDMNAILNFYIGNQRVIKDIEIGNFGALTLGENSVQAGTAPPSIFRLETPVVIPPQIEFYATVRLDSSGSQATRSFVLTAFGQGTLLNTKSNF